MAKRTCSVKECPDPVEARGWCHKHYQKWRKYGDPLADLRPARSACKVDDCSDLVESRGWCSKHYQRWRVHGDPLMTTAAKPRDPPPVCIIEDCARPHRSQGYCHRHYENLRRCGDPVPRADRTLEARLRETGWTVTESGCWEWDGRRNADSYGIFDAARLGFLNARAHRVMYEHYVKPVPDGLDLRHKCDNPPCVNPDHLIPGTRLDNMRDMIERGRNMRAKCVNGHDLTLPGATRRAMRGGLMCTLCLKCERDRWDRNNQRDREKRKREKGS